jgi:hypothetical protein
VKPGSNVNIFNVIGLLIPSLSLFALRAHAFIGAVSTMCGARI